MTSSSLLRPTNQKQTICYCKSGECSAPKPEWCIGRRYADGFREFNAQSGAEPVAWQLVPKKPTKEMIQAAYARQHDGTTVLYFKMWNAMLDAAPAPPRPDASAGLIEIEEAFLWLADEPIAGTQKEKDEHLDKMPMHFNETMRKVRARAAKRSGK